MSADQITTVEELAALPVGSVVLDRSGIAIQARSQFEPNDEVIARRGPFRVIFRPESQALADVDRLIDEHSAIWRKVHASHGITLAESKADWLGLLQADPGMDDPINWGDLAGTTTPDGRDQFKAWLEERAVQ